MPQNVPSRIFPRDIIIHPNHIPNSKDKYTCFVHNTSIIAITEGKIDQNPKLFISISRIPNLQNYKLYLFLIS